MAALYGAYVLRGEMMNPNYNQTITIYNCLRAADNPEERKDVWQRTVLHDCFYKNVMGKAESGNGLKMENVCTARIPASESYMPYRDWAALPEQERRSRFTCGLRDIVVKGECTEEITGMPPHTAAELVAGRKPEAFVVTAFSDNTSSRKGKHYRLGG